MVRACFGWPGWSRGCGRVTGMKAARHGRRTHGRPPQRSALTPTPPSGLWASLPEARWREAVRILSMLLERAAVPGPATGGVGGEPDAAG